MRSKNSSPNTTSNHDKHRMLVAAGTLIAVTALTACTSNSEAPSPQQQAAAAAQAKVTAEVTALQNELNSHETVKIEVAADTKGSHTYITWPADSGSTPNTVERPVILDDKTYAYFLFRDSRVDNKVIVKTVSADVAKLEQDDKQVDKTTVVQDKEISIGFVRRRDSDAKYPEIDVLHNTAQPCSDGQYKQAIVGIGKPGADFSGMPPDGIHVPNDRGAIECDDASSPLTVGIPYGE